MSVCSGMINREKRKEARHKQFIQVPSTNLKVVLSPLHFQGEFTKCNIWLQMLKHTSKRLQMLKHKQEISNAQAHKQETSNQTKLQEKCLRLNTWYTISGVHNVIQIQTLKTFEFQGHELENWNSKWTLDA